MAATPLYNSTSQQVDPWTPPDISYQLALSAASASGAGSGSGSSTGSGGTSSSASGGSWNLFDAAGPFLLGGTRIVDPNAIGNNTQIINTLTNDTIQGGMGPAGSRGAQQLDAQLAKAQENAADAHRLSSDPEFLHLANWTSDDVLTGLGIGAQIGASMVPVVGEAMDAYVLFHPDSEWYERALAGTSLGINIYTAGLAPNFGAVSSRVLRTVTKSADNAGEAGALMRTFSHTADDVAGETGEIAGNAARALDDAKGTARQGAYAATDAAPPKFPPLHVLQRTCFASGTPVRTPVGAQAIETLQPGQLVLSRSEVDLDGEVHPRAVEAVFRREQTIVELHLGGRKIETTAEHPVFVRSQGWTPVQSLRVGDWIVGLEDHHAMPVAAIVLTDRVATVYNLRVAEDHTYFVGDVDWGFAVWAHNTYSAVDGVLKVSRTGELLIWAG